MQCKAKTVFAAFVVSMLAVIAPAMLATGAPGATPSTIYDAAPVDSPDPQDTGRWGERIVMAGDINDDGVNDYFVAAPSHSDGGLDNSGRVYLMSGRTHTMLYRIDSPEPQDGADFGFYISAFGDANGDGELDTGPATGD